MVKLKLFRFNRFLFYLLIEILVVFAVTFLFKILNDQIKLAAVLAGSLFCLMPLLFLIFELKISKRSFKIWLSSILVFLFVFALPMLIMRILHWDEDFGSIRIWGMPGPEFHSLSRWSYIAMISATIVAIFQENRRKN